MNYERMQLKKECIPVGVHSFVYSDSAISH